MNGENVWPLVAKTKLWEEVGKTLAETNMFGRGMLAPHHKRIMNGKNIGRGAAEESKSTEE